MRVLQLTGPMEGGIRRHVEALLEGLPAEGVECGLAGPVKTPQAGAGWIELALTDRSASALSPRNIAALGSAWRRGGWDLVHAHGYKAAALAGATSLLAPGLRYV